MKNIQKRKYSSLLLSVFCCLILCSLSGCSLKLIKASKNIVYLKADSVTGKPEQQLNVFVPRRHKKPKNVFVFIHGGNWNSGKKSTYNILGKKLAHKNLAAVIIGYPLSPKAGYHEMATDAAISVKWVKDNIQRYGGNPDKIFVSGHSAGGHLAALIAVKDSYFDTLQIPNPIKGAVLIDAAGLDMYTYLKDENLKEGDTYINTFSLNQNTWKAASPLHHLHKGIPPMLIYEGGRTYPSIIKGTKTFVKALKSMDAEYTYVVQKRKKHVAMITQFLNSWNPRYKEIRRFMEEN